MEITRATLNEVQLLQTIAKKTFSEAFSAQNSTENLEDYLNESFSIKKLTSELKNEDSQFYFAWSNDEIVGYLKINTGVAQTEILKGSSLEIERIYVLQQYYGKEVGRLLYNKAMEVAHQLKVDFMWLGVWEENPRAIRFYEKNGFVAFDKHMFKLGDEEQTDLMMKKIL